MYIVFFHVLGSPVDRPGERVCRQRVRNVQHPSGTSEVSTRLRKKCELVKVEHLTNPLLRNSHAVQHRIVLRAHTKIDPGKGTRGCSERRGCNGVQIASHDLLAVLSVCCDPLNLVPGMPRFLQAIINCSTFIYFFNPCCIAFSLYNSLITNITTWLAEKNHIGTQYLHYGLVVDAGPILSHAHLCNSVNAFALLLVNKCIFWEYFDLY